VEKNILTGLTGLTGQKRNLKEYRKYFIIDYSLMKINMLLTNEIQFIQLSCPKKIPLYKYKLPEK